ncbi:hypothetical protein BJV82DRAFT_670472 [Fennellomyces sp. T-0311]|nr:hypothetical protein BJV82DRAFT_670472 [Fennellomyces sp. T-0311]
MNEHKRKSFVDLPNEIIAHIATYLDNNDIIDCMCVSRSWNSFFRTFRRLSVDLVEKASAAAFLAALKEQSSQKTKRRKLDTTQQMDNLGQYVRQLRLEDGLMTSSNMQQLAAMCPNVTTVRFDWYDGGNPPKESTKSTRRFRSPIPFFEHFHPATLTCLDLDGEFAPSMSVVFTWDTILDVLRRLPQLESLTMTFDRFFPALSYMEELHTLCPKLIRLKIGWVNWRNDDTSIPQSKIKHVTPSATMRSLSFPSAMSADWRMQSTPWYQYITHKYPSLTSLEIFPVAQYKGFLPNPPSRDDNTLQLRSIWPNLATLNFDVFTGHPCTALPLLVKGIPNVTLRGDVTVHFSQWISNDATHNITQLSISTLPAALSDLSYCTHLRELCLGYDNSYIGYKVFQELPIDIVLSSCRALEVLSAFKCHIRQSENCGSTHQPLPLRKLVLSKCAFAHNRILRHIGERCPRLTHLDMHRCIWIDTDRYPVIEIPFPQSWLMYFRLVAPTICSTAIRTILETPSRFRTSSTSQTRQPRWVIDHDDQRSNECLMLKMAEHNESNPPLLFWSGPNKAHPEATMSRISSTDITQWLSLRADGFKSDALWLKANQGLEAMRVHRPDIGFIQHWSTLLCCRGVDRFYYHAGRLVLIERCPHHNTDYGTIAVLLYVPQLESLRITGQMTAVPVFLPVDTSMTLSKVQAATPTRIIQKFALSGDSVWGNRHPCNGT